MSKNRGKDGWGKLKKKSKRRNQQSRERRKDKWSDVRFDLSKRRRWRGTIKNTSLIQIYNVKRMRLPVLFFLFEKWKEKWTNNSFDDSNLLNFYIIF